MPPPRSPAPPDASDAFPLLPASDLDALRAALAGRYTVERPIGAGGMGSVWLGRDEALDRPVAIKVIAPELTTSAVLRGRFLQEARTVARLRHPHVVQVYAAGEAGSLLWFAMEYVAGGSLRDRLEALGPVPAAEAAAALRDLADALAAAHAAGVVHRDLKPENVLVELETGRVRLTDFGVARALQEAGAAGDGRLDGRLTRTGMVMGSPRYMSPEQAGGDRTLDGRSDLYALGLVGYELLAGRPAFDGPTGATLLVRQLTEPPAPLAPLAPGAPPALVAVIERALEKDPARRWPDAAAMRDALDEAVPGAARGRTPNVTYPPNAAPAPNAIRPLTGGPSSADATAPTPAAAPARRPHRRPWWRHAAVPAAAAAALLGVAGYGAARYNAGAPPAGVDPRRSFAVAPFDVLSPDPQLRWLREGSVNMLTLDLAQWRDVRVADYERTLDALRDLRLDAAGRVGRDDARALARRVGAWTVVTGRVQGTGDSLFVVASLYDVASGRKLDEAQRGAPRAADPRPLFDLVARDLLDLAGAPPITVDLTRTTTASLAAYRAYLDGVRALNSWRLGEADSLFAQAVAEDSTFALAWYKRALGSGWANTDDDASLAYVARARAHADRLAPAQRGLVAAYWPLARSFSAEGLRGGPPVMAALLDSARLAYAAVVAADSMSADGWYGLGDAWYHYAEAEQGLMADALTAAPDSARRRAVSRAYAQRLGHAYSASRRAFERTIALDSSYHLAYSHLVGIYQALAAPIGYLVLDGDSLRVATGAADVRAFGGPARVEAARVRARVLATDAARAWAAADPDSPAAQLGLMRAFAAVGRPDSAVAAAERALARPGMHEPAVAYAAVSAQFAADPAGVGPVLERALARFPADSVRGRNDPAAALGFYTHAAAAAAGVGRLADARAVLAAGAAAVPVLQAPGSGPGQPTRPLLQLYATALELAAGLPAGPRAARLLSGLRATEDGMVRVAGPAFAPKVMSGFVPLAYTGYLATGDTAFASAAGRWLRPTGATPPDELDALGALARGDASAAAAIARAFPPPAPPTTLGLTGLRAIARAELYARSGDPRRALAWYEYLDPARFIGIGSYETGAAAYAGSLLARGALYEQVGDRARAAGAYERFLALRRGADPAFAAQVAAARAGLARVRDAGGRPVPVVR